MERLPRPHIVFLRKEEQSVIINPGGTDQVEIKVIKIKKNRVVIVVQAPEGIKVLRSELLCQTNNQQKPEPTEPINDESIERPSIPFVPSVQPI